MRIHNSTTARFRKGSANIVALIISGLLAVSGSLYFFTQAGPKIPSTPPPTSSPTVLEEKNPSPSKYPTHQNITATVFWVGENADSSNDFIHNRSSAWMEDWVSAYGGVDNPQERCGYVPCDFTPAENSFYFALPFGDYDESGLKPASELKIVPWYEGEVAQGSSLLKNRWIQVTHNGKTAYGQWEDVGPFGENDGAYVFGSAAPAEPRAGLDLSPAFANTLGINGRGVVSWRFVDEQDVPNGPWKNVITRSNPRYAS